VVPPVATIELSGHNRTEMTPEQSDPAMRTEGLTEMALFEGCQADQLVPLAGRLSPLLAEPGQVLMRQG